MMKFDESRKRPIIIIAFTVLVGASLGYMYSYSRSNRLLLNKHAALSFDYKTCKSRSEKCTSNLNKCFTSGEQLQDSQKRLKLSLESHQNGLTSLQKSLEETKNKLAIAYQFYFDVSVITGISDPADTKSEEGLTSEMVNSIKEKVIQLKKNKADHDILKMRYTALEGNQTRLIQIKKSLSLKVKALQNDKNVIGETLENLKKEKSLADIENTNLVKRINQNNMIGGQGDANNNVAKINKMIDKEKQTANDIKNYLQDAVKNVEQKSNINGTFEKRNQGSSISNVTKQDQTEEVKQRGQSIAVGNQRDQNTNVKVSNEQDNVKPTNANTQDQNIWENLN